MHFALPPRKTSNPPPYARPSPATRSRRLKLGATIAVGILALLYLLSRLFGSSEEWRPPGTPEVVIVTVFDHEKMSKEYIGRIKENREDYAQRHGIGAIPPLPSGKTY
jgi:mannan polymerase II complex MNN11 subunit